MAKVYAVLCIQSFFLKLCTGLGSQTVTHRNYGILKKLSGEVVTLPWKLMDISYSERKTFPATFLPGEVWPFALHEGSQDNFFYLQCILIVCGTLRNLFESNFYKICVYFILKEIKRTLLEKMLTILPPHSAERCISPPFFFHPPALLDIPLSFKTCNPPSWHPSWKKTRFYDDALE